MKKMRGLIVLISCAVIMLVYVGVVHSESINDIKHSGSTGTCKWEITNGGKLTVKPESGNTCTMNSSTNNTSSPWYAYREEIVEAKFEYGVRAADQLKGLFYNAKNLKKIDLGDLDTSNVINMSHMFANCTSLEEIDLSYMFTAKVEDMSYMFHNVKLVKELDLSNFDTSNVLDMSYMFNGCSQLESINLHSLDTKKVVNMQNMFASCKALKELNVSNFNTSNVENMQSMLSGLTSLKRLDLSSFDTRKVTNFASMLSNNNSLEYLDISSFDTRNATLMESLFNSTGSLKTVRIGNNFDFHITTIPGGTGSFGRGTWKRVEDNKEVAAVDIPYLENKAGTYVKQSNIIDAMKINFPVDYRLETPTKFDSFTTTRSDVFAYKDKVLYIKDLSKAESDDYTVPGSVTVKFNDVVKDINNNSYDLELKVDNIHLYDINTDTSATKFNTDFLSLGTGGISLNCNCYDQETGDRVYTKSSISQDVTIRILDKNNNPITGKYAFSIYDVDIASFRDIDTPYVYISGSRGYGDYSEGITLLEGFNKDSLIMHKNALLVEYKPNRITGLAPDNGTELTEVISQVDASKFKFNFTVPNTAGSSIFSYYQPRVVEFNNVDESGKNLAGSTLELYDSNNKLVEKWTSTTETKKVFVTPGKYILKETSAPEGYEKDTNKVFYADIKDALIIDNENVSSIITVNKLKSYPYTINYINKDTNEVFETKTDNAKYASKVYAKDFIKDIEGYNYLSSSSKEITIKKDNNKIDIYYTISKNIVTAKYIDINTNKLIDIDVIEAQVGTQYKTEQKEFDNYKFVKVEGSPTGKLKDVETTITYYYQGYYSITTEVENGTIDDSINLIDYGTSKKVTFTPKEGYQLQKIIIDGKEVDVSKYKDGYTFDNITESHSIKVVFAMNPPTGAFANTILFIAISFVMLLTILFIKRRSIFYRI